MGTSIVEQLRSDELELIKSAAASGRVATVLKGLDERGAAQEIVRQQYSGRYPFELLQNANDAAAEVSVVGKVRFVLTGESLIVADNGAGFQEKQVQAICGLARSSKDPRKSVGYKGLGFKSVGEITNNPQIISGNIRFQFDHSRVFGCVEEIVGSLDIRQRLPIYAFPFDLLDDSLGQDSSVVHEAITDGFRTVLRFPFKNGVTREEVERQLHECLVPRLLLFLVAIEELEIRGTRRDFRALMTRESGSVSDEVLLQSGELLEHWIVFRKALNPDRGLLDPLGPAWAEVETVHVAVAVRLDEQGLPSSSDTYPIHVYFPTEEQTGLPVVIQGDFSLQFDRRQLGLNPESVPYNELLLDEVAELTGDVVATALAERFTGTATNIKVLIPSGEIGDVGRSLKERWARSLKGCQFLPGRNGGLLTPLDALLLPRQVNSPIEFYRHIDVSDCTGLLHESVDLDFEVRKFLAESLEVSSMEISYALSRINEPDANFRTSLYEMLVHWSDEISERRFAPLLSKVRFITTTDGRWLSPAEHVYFPRKSEDVKLPVEMPVPIADLPDVEGLESLLRASGVRDFEWRDLLRDFVLPPLQQKSTDEDLRRRALLGLRTYFQNQRGGDQDLSPQMRRVLLPSRSASGGNHDLRAASALYFPSEWSGSNRLELIYGAFGESEFLNVEVPADEDDRSEEIRFFEQLGVARHPRVIDAETTEKDRYLRGNLNSHPHSVVGSTWNAWQDLPDFQSAMSCGQEHPASQQLRSSYRIDRFLELAETGDLGRSKALWMELAENWGGTYEPCMWSVVHCQNTSHRGDRDRRCSSLLSYMLSSVAWVPAIRDGLATRVRPSQAWRPSQDTPKWVRSRVPLLDSQMLGHAGINLATTLDIVDAARPNPSELISFLWALQVEHDDAPTESKELVQAARWGMRTLNDVLGEDELDLSDHPVPLLARFQGRSVFAVCPVVADDPLLAEAWEPYHPVLAGDTEMRKLHRAFRLIDLTDPRVGVKITAVPSPANGDIQRLIERAVNKAKPFLAAVASVNTPSRELDVIRGLKSLEMLACSNLSLKHEFRGQTLIRDDADSHMVTRREKVSGTVYRRVGTAYLLVEPNEMTTDWYSFGPQLASFLDVSSLGDSFSVLLSGSDRDRHRYLKSRRISADLVDEMRLQLELPEELDEIEEMFDFSDFERLTTVAGIQDEVVVDVYGVESGNLTVPDPDIGAIEDALTTWPAIDLNAIVMNNATSGQTIGAIEVHGLGHFGGGGYGFAPSGLVDFEGNEWRKREIGRRGEEAAFQAEQRRLEAFGLDQKVVVWRSKSDNACPWDLESVDEDGQRIFIEVKSTTSNDYQSPFVISLGELMQAVEKRSRYYIYRVVNVDTSAPAIRRFQDPMGYLLEGRAEMWLSGARMSLRSEDEDNSGEL